MKASARERLAEIKTQIATVENEIESWGTDGEFANATSELVMMVEALEAAVCAYDASIA
jgi:hypothetical protein